jgi:hypothetical protein
MILLLSLLFAQTLALEHELLWQEINLQSVVISYLAPTRDSIHHQ